VTLTYFIRSEDGPVKIGVSKDIGKRLKTLQTASHAKLTLVGYVDRDVEAALHKRQESDHISGEWFKPSKSLALAIYIYTMPPAERPLRRPPPATPGWTIGLPARAALMASINAGDWVDVPKDAMGGGNDLDLFDWHHELHECHKRLFGKSAELYRGNATDEGCDCEACQVNDAALHMVDLPVSGFCTCTGDSAVVLVLRWPDGGDEETFKVALSYVAWCFDACEMSLRAFLLTSDGRVRRVDWYPLAMGDWSLSDCPQVPVRLAAALVSPVVLNPHDVSTAAPSAPLPLNRHALSGGAGAEGGAA
jgi:hypothetical protein